MPGVSVLSGQEGLCELAEAGADVVINGLVGAVGLEPTLAALGQGRTVAMANKAARIAWVIMTRGEAYRAHRPATEGTA